jgi:hypothetical protein
MKEALDKILNNFVFKDIDVLHYKVYVNRTPISNEKNYEIEVFVSPNYSEETVEGIGHKIETSMKMLGFKDIWVSYNHIKKGNITVIKTYGNIKLK